MTYSTVSWKALLVTAALALPGLAFAAEPVTMKDGIGVDHKGMAVYTYDEDSASKSMCKGDCAKNWPPLIAPAGAKAEGKWTTVKRDDGTMQWAYDGKPLYTFMKDEKPGEMKGDGMKSVWHVMRESQK